MSLVFSKRVSILTIATAFDDRNWAGVRTRKYEMLTRTYWMMTIVKEMYTARGISLNSQKDDNDCMTCILIQTKWQNKTKIEYTYSKFKSIFTISMYINNFKPHYLHLISYFTFSKKSQSKISINSKEEIRPILNCI